MYIHINIYTHTHILTALLAELFVVHFELVGAFLCGRRVELERPVYILGGKGVAFICTNPRKRAHTQMHTHAQKQKITHAKIHTSS